jgi:branched-chain amino acid transport system permease protein
MDLDIALLVGQDGITSGAVYAMMALGMVLIFNSTRIIFVPFGDLVAYAALTLGYFQLHQRPGTAWLVLVLAIVAWLLEVVRLLRRGNPHRLARATLSWLILPLVPSAAALSIADHLPPSLQSLLAILIVLPIGPLLYRIIYQPIANASVLLLLTVSVALHFALSGIALLCFGPEGLRTTPFLKSDLEIGDITISSQMLMMVLAAAALSGVLYFFFGNTINGKALKATAMNREGARLVGIRTHAAGATAFLLATAIASLTGVLISPTTTFYYDSGFMTGLKGFVGATFGGFVGYPAAVFGALLIGLIESTSSFYVSALKEVIVFASIIPIVLLRWIAAGSAKPVDHSEDE